MLNVVNVTIFGRFEPAGKCLHAHTHTVHYNIMMDRLFCHAENPLKSQLSSLLIRPHFPKSKHYCFAKDAQLIITYIVL